MDMPFSSLFTREIGGLCILVSNHETRARSQRMLLESTSLLLIKTSMQVIMTLSVFSVLLLFGLLCSNSASCACPSPSLFDGQPGSQHILCVTCFRSRAC